MLVGDEAITQMFQCQRRSDTERGLQGTAENNVLMDMVREFGAPVYSKGPLNSGGLCIWCLSLQWGTYMT